MKAKVSPALVGFFVLGFLILGLLALLSFGGVNLFSRPQRFVVYFDESIHGLDLGSPVKLSGVRIGRVVDLALDYEESQNHAVVAVTCELSHNMMRDGQGKIIDVTKREKLDQFIRSGLRAQLGVQGLATGLLFVELDFVDPEVYPAGDVPKKQELAVVPSMPSAISEFQASLTEILAGLKKVDFPGLSKEVHGLLTDVRKQVNSLNLADVSANWSKAGKSVGSLAESPEIKQVLTRLTSALDQMSRTLAVIEVQVQPTGKELSETLAAARTAIQSFNETAKQANTFISAQGGLSEDASRALMQLMEAASSIQRLAEFIERNPNALVSGKAAPQSK